MLTIISPAKSLDMSPTEHTVHSEPEYKSKAVSLNALLKKMSALDLQQFMGISESLAIENRARYKQFKRDHHPGNSKQAIFTFNGDVYRGLDAQSLGPEDLAYAQNHLRILSGMYGILRPLDLIQPYRLEMGRPLVTKQGKDLYQFWDRRITQTINREIKVHQHKALVNLASKEYARVVHFPKVRIPVIDVDFREERNGQLKFLSFHAKKARGLMARYIIENRIESIEDLMGFDYEDYHFSKAHSTTGRFLFMR